MQNIAKIVAHWRTQDLDLLPPASESAVRDAIEGLGAVATTDVIYLYSLLGGMQRMDNDFWRLWTLDEIKSENTAPSSGGILFSDYLIYSWCYRLRFNSDGTSAVFADYFDGSMPIQVATSLEDFFGQYLVDARRLLDEQSIR